MLAVQPARMFERPGDALVRELGLPSPEVQSPGFLITLFINFFQLLVELPRTRILRPQLNALALNGHLVSEDAVLGGVQFVRLWVKEAQGLTRLVAMRNWGFRNAIDRGGTCSYVIGCLRTSQSLLLSESI